MNVGAASTKGRTIRKVMGGGRGIFSLHDFFFSPSPCAGIFFAGETLCTNFFFRQILLCLSFTYSPVGARARWNPGFSQNKHAQWSSHRRSQ